MKEHPGNPRIPTLRFVALQAKFKKEIPDVGTFIHQGRTNPAFSFRLDQSYVNIMLVWFGLCWTGMLGNIANWAHTDVLCGEIIAPLLEGGRIELSALASWREAQYKYQRRAVPVAMLGLLAALRLLPWWARMSATDCVARGPWCASVYPAIRDIVSTAASG